MPPKRKGPQKKRKASQVSDGAGPSAEPEPQRPCSAQGAAPQTAEANNAENSAAERQNKALALLLSQVPGLPQDKAKRALELAAENHGEFEDVEAWAEEAAIELACLNECDDESKEMGVAMEISLAEAEERKASEKPIEERAGKEILELYDGSEMLAALGRAVGSQEALIELIDAAEADSAVKKKLVEYLYMEKRCKKWYSCSQGYFAKVAGEVQQQVAEEVARRQSNHGKALGKGEDKAKNDLSNGSNDASAAIKGPLEHREAIFGILLPFCDGQLTTLTEKVLLINPEEGESVPSIFANFAHEEVELLDE